jgi:hypothetical protein
MSRDGDCRNCGEPASGKHSLPVSPEGTLVSVRFEGRWGAVPSCETCCDLHRAAVDSGPAVLAIYKRGIEDLRRVLEEQRSTLHTIHQMSRE